MDMRRLLLREQNRLNVTRELNLYFVHPKRNSVALCSKFEKKFPHYTHLTYISSYLCLCYLEIIY